MNNDLDQQSTLELQMLWQHMQQLQQHVSTLQQHHQELQRLQHHLQEMSTITSGTSLYFPMGSGIFFSGVLQDSKHLLMNVGAGICVEKSVPDALETLGKQLVDVESLLTQFETQLEQGSERLQELQKE
ncbi:prefoldin subunit alpha [Candidatus Woesearchaeota archaeon]|nr:prefoldin subunit alpha [Candidatus Woesearchaeota archaeon]